jgi:4-amino-4-deoxy-L-arabinose transferase-like glycosyltransferase
MYENIDRFIGKGEFRTQRARLSQAIWLVTQLFPWSLVLLAALVRSLRSGARDDFRWYLHSWWLSIFGFFLFSSGQRAVYLLPIYPAVALLVAAECAAFLDARRCGREGPRWQRSAVRSAPAVLGIGVLSLALAAPISRAARENRSDQDEFVEDVVLRLPANAALYAAPRFPETVLIVLAYRLNRNIETRPIQCDGDSYYLSTNTGSSCLGDAQTTVSHRGKQPLQLIHIAPRSR